MSAARARGWHDPGAWPGHGQTGWGRAGRRRPPAVWQAAMVALLQVLITRAAAGDQDPGRSLDLAGYLLLLAGPVALAARRRTPVMTLAVALAATLVYALAGYPSGPYFLAAVFALFAAVAAGRRAAAWALVAAAYAGYAAAPLLPGVAAAASPYRDGPARVLLVGVWVAVFLLLAEAGRARSLHLAQQSRYHAAQARSRAEQERRQASEERLRIARELHDVLGHHLSLINVQAGVGLHLMDSRPQQARDALAAIKTASAEALREVRAVLDVLRTEEEAAPRAPAPGLDRLDDLTAGAGLPVRVRVRGTARPLPPEVDRAAYRVVQEALTNVRRHAGPAATATVTIGYEQSDVTVRVDDDGAGADRPAAAAGAGDGSGDDAAGAGAADASVGSVPAGGGSGIAGMRERVAALGGSLVAGPREPGFRVEARLPAPEPPQDAPGLDAPGHDGPGHDAPGHDAPGSGGPGRDAPGCAAPGYDARARGPEAPRPGLPFAAAPGEAP